MKFQTKYYELDYEDAAIRSVKYGNCEIIRMIYSAVRDRNWGTVSKNIISENIQQFIGGFKINLSVEYVQNEINFRANYLIRGRQNQISIEMQGKAISSFLKNRIGFCVLHPIKECAEKKGTVLHTDNSIEEFKFPKQIAPHHPVKNIKQINWNPDVGIEAQLTFEGDIFEMEDQRNWTDASYKTYCTPLELPFPVEVKKGEEFNQKIILNVDIKQKKQSAKEKEISFYWDNNSMFKLPEIGFGKSSRKKMISEEEIKLLSTLQIQHLRADIHMDKDNWQTEMNKAVNEAGLLKVPLFLCLYFPDDYQSKLEAVLEYFSGKQKLLKAILPVGMNHLPHPAFKDIAEQIRSRFRDVKVGTGVNAYFAELNRNRPDASNADFVCFSACPQIHAFDKKSIIENLEGLAEVVKSAKKLFPGKRIWISPVTLKQRFNVVATEEEKYSGLEEMAPQVDPRQQSMFAAGWTMGALKQLAQSGANLIDFYETVGWRGILNMDLTSNLLPELNKTVFPLINLFRVISEAKHLLSSVSSHPDLIDGIVFKKEGTTEIFLAKYSETNQIVKLPLNDSNICLYSLQGYHENPKVLHDSFELKIRLNEAIILSL